MRREYILSMMSEADGGMAVRRLELVSDFSAQLHAVLADGDRALNEEGDLRASRSCFARAYQLAELAGDVRAQGLAALGLAGLWVSESRTVTGAVLLETRLQRVLSLVDDRSPLALRIRARLAAESDYRRGEHAAIQSVLAEARAVADPVALAEALSLAHHCMLGPDDVAMRRDLAVELVRVSFRTGRRSDRLMGLLWQTVDAYAQGHPHAGRLLTELREELRQRDHPAVGFVVSAIEVMLAIRAGRLEQAEDLAGACASSGEAAGDIDREWWPSAQLVTIRWYQGRLTELLPMLQERVHSPSLSAVDNSTVVALAVAAAIDGDRRAAASCLAALRGSDLANLPRSSSWLVTMNGIAEAAYLLADAETAAYAYDLLLPYAHLPMLGGLGVTCFGSVRQGLGIASLTVGRPDQAIDHLRAAVQHNLALGHWPALVSARQRLAHAYRMRGAPGDAEAAGQELQSAIAEAAPLNIPMPGEHTPRAAEAARCERAGRNWRIVLADRSILVEDSIGMLHLAVLLANPRQDIAAAELAAGLAALGGAASAGATAQPLLDHDAILEYRARLQQLDEAQVQDGPEAAQHARAEREWLLAQLASAAGLGGRTRAFPDDGERARVAVGKAIRRALARVAAADPVIGSHLRQSVHTGVRCSYWPG